MKKISVVFITADKKAAVKNITDAILKERLAACVNTISNVNSTYWWKGKIEKAKEFLMIVKTPGSNVKKLIKRVKELHPYEVAEIIAFDIKDGNRDYIAWAIKETK